MGTQAARKPPQKQQTTRGKPPEVPRATQGGYFITVLGSNGGKAFQNLTNMSTTMASESSGRIPELKTTMAVSSSTSGTAPTGSQTSSLLVSQHPLLSAARRPPEEATKPRGWGGRGLEEPRVESKISSFFMYLSVGTLWHYGSVINKAFHKVA